MTLAKLRELSVDELNSQIQDANKALFEARMKHSMQQLENTALNRQLKHQVAQLKTILAEKSRQA